MRLGNGLKTLAAITALAALPVLASAPTLKTIAVDGDMADWAEVLTNPVQYTVDGASASNCTQSSDLDCPVGSTGRDLTGFAWTYDSTNIYMFLRRVGSSSNVMNFFFVMDVDADKRLKASDFVLGVKWQGSNRSTVITLYRYAPADAAAGDMLVSAGGYADGYDLPGSLGDAVWTTSAYYGGSLSGTEMETFVPWAQLGLAWGRPIYFHVSSSINTSLAQTVDNLGGPGGGLGAFGFYGATLAPGRTGNCAPGGAASYAHTLTNSGTFADTYALKTTSSMGYPLTLLVNGTLAAYDADGNGRFTDPGDTITAGFDTNGDGYPDVSLASGTAVSLTLEVAPRPTPETAQDTSVLRATSSGDASVYAVTDTTFVGRVTLSPDGNATGVAALAIPFDHTLVNNLAPDDFRLTASVSAPCRLDLYADATLIATDLTGDGVWDTVTPGYDPDGTGAPQVYVGTGGGQALRLVLTPPSGTPVGAVLTAVLTAQGRTNGGSDPASDTATILQRLTMTPSYTIAGGANKYGAAGYPVTFAHTLVNSAPTDDRFSFYAAGYAPASTAGYTVTLFSDPDGDGNPSDGAVITGTGLVAKNGGVFHFVVMVDVPDSVSPPATDTTVVTAVRCGRVDCSSWDPSVLASVTDETRVAYIVPFSDPSRTLTASAFAPCGTVYAKGFNLAPDVSGRYGLVTTNPSGATVRSVSLPTDTAGSLEDAYTFPASAPAGTWTLTLTSYGTPIDSATVVLQRSATASVTPARKGLALSGDPLVAAASLHNGNAVAAYAATRAGWVVRDPAGTTYLRADGTWGPYAAGSLTAEHSPMAAVAGATVSDTLSLASAAFPGYGIYGVRVTWETSCGSAASSADDLASASADLYVVSWLSFADAARTVAASSFEVPAPAHLRGDGYGSGIAYPVAIYAASGALVSTASATSSGGLLDFSAATSALNALGTYRAAVYAPGATPPATLNPSGADLLAVLDFDATLSPPALAGPVWAGDAFVSGTCTAPAGSMVTLYRNGTPVGTAAVQPDGTYVVTPSAAPGAGDVLTASVHVALVESAPSTPLTVAEGTLGFSGPAAGALLNRVDDANLALSGYQTSATGTGKPGAAIVVTDASGNVLGAGVVGADGTYSVTITLVPGATSDLTATQTDAAGNTLAATHPDVGFDPRPNLLRSDRITSLSPVTPALATFLVQGQPSLAIWGPDGLAGRGEGAGTTANGSSDDDDFYVASLDAGAYDPDTTVASDGARPLVFYQLDLPGDALRVTKEKDAGGVLRVKLSY